ncbi:MAG: 3-isopropylmalate dehydrogenase [Chthonomonadaceae bacterium]|uniref:3-isopropylmalate dehydrogenase n=1 Tax=Candidatus Nitrosymbiomonas proteolyticus TaxID=2608984 RepID=A0A809RAG4_9BACT|nr:MAG: 3-isopropylmalate dehydrogenase [Armatimonadota bacterium]BBO24563.1 3-isopropylmalate dehydrogenase [Candidatus Nitrosymbiomonas proteolyticus]GIK33133.1 MAG: 3-isopropylmalate dehydrogenase [Armatimonadota bacterium]
MSHKVAVLAGDGIGPEVIAEAVKVLRRVSSDLEFESALVGGAAYDDCGRPLPEATLDLCRNADAVLLGAVGGPKWDAIEPVSLRPEVGALLPLRRELNLYANVRPAKTLGPLLSASPLKGDRGLIDLVVVRELTGGIYFGTPRERRDEGRVAVDTAVYSQHEVERIAARAFEIARARRKEIVSVDKANVLETSRLWRETVTRMAAENPDVKVSHMLIDNCAMQLIRDPRQFDVILTENMFGDILSDEASMITGSLGLLPSASLSDTKNGKVFGMYEPVHGSAPDIAGQGRANPLAAILSAAMMLRYSFGEGEGAARIDRAVESALEQGLRTADIFVEGTKLVSTSEMGDAVSHHLEAP